MNKAKQLIPGLEKAKELIESIRQGDFGTKGTVEFKRTALMMIERYTDLAHEFVETACENTPVPDEELLRLNELCEPGSDMGRLIADLQVMRKKDSEWESEAMHLNNALGAVAIALSGETPKEMSDYMSFARDVEEVVRARDTLHDEVSRLSNERNQARTDYNEAIAELGAVRKATQKIDCAVIEGTERLAQELTSEREAHSVSRRQNKEQIRRNDILRDKLSAVDAAFALRGEENKRLTSERDDAITRERDEAYERLKTARIEWNEQRAENTRLREDNDSRQHSIEIVGKALAELLPTFRASGTGEQHSAAVAEAIKTEVHNLKAKLAEAEKNEVVLRESIAIAFTACRIRFHAGTTRGEQIAEHVTTITRDRDAELEGEIRLCSGCCRLEPNPCNQTDPSK